MGEENPKGIFPFISRSDAITRAQWEKLGRSRISGVASEARNRAVLQAIIDNLAEPVALIDGSGTIVMVNSAWGKVARSFSGRSFGIGDDYREVCRHYAEQGSRVLEALEEFYEGRRSHFEHIYRMQGRTCERSFRLVLSNVVLEGVQLVALASYEITDLETLKHQNGQLERARLQVQEAEGRRIGREIHDTTAQELAVLKLSLARLRSLQCDPQASDVLDEADEALAHVVDEIRATSFMLHPPPLEDGLANTLSLLSRGFARRTGLHIDFLAEGTASSWSEDVDQVFYRVAQEALTNVHRHAEASQVWMRLLARRTALHPKCKGNAPGSWRRHREYAFTNKRTGGTLLYPQFRVRHPGHCERSAGQSCKVTLALPFRRPV
jgi:two-component system, NarL family, sensor kinase